MKAINQQYVKIVSIILIGLASLSSDAQKIMAIDMQLIQLDTVQVGSHTSVDKFISKIVLTEHFKYRKTLKKSRDSKRQLVFDEQTISEVEVLKHLKKAARKSDSVDMFISYFYDRNLSFINSLDGTALSLLYDKIRSTTFNGYLDELESVVGTGY